MQALLERQTRGLVVVTQEASAEVSVWELAAGQFRRYRQGDHGALDDLVRTLTPVLWHVVRAVGLDSDKAEDVVQVTWLTLVRKQGSIADPQAVASWLTTTARREAWRVARVDARSSPVADEVLQTRIPHQPAAESDVIRNDEQDRLWACVQQLDERCQRLLRSVAFDDRPDYAGMSEELGMPVGSIGPTRGRCLTKLKTLLVAQGGAGDD